MKRNNFAAYGLIIVLVFGGLSCRQQSQQQFKITCKVSNVTFPFKIYLKKWTHTGLSIIDSGMISKKHNSLIFRGDYKEEKLYTIFSLDKKITGSRLNIIVSDTPMTIYLNVNDKNWLSARITGSSASVQYRNYVKKVLAIGGKRKAFQVQLDSLYKVDAPADEIRKGKEMLKHLNERDWDLEYKEVLHTKDPIFTWWLLSSMQIDSGVAKIQPLVSRLKGKFNNSFLGHYFDNYKKLKSNMYIYNSLPKKITNFILPTYSGDTLSLQKVLKHNDFTLVNFWASWCGPCVKEIPILKKSYNTYHQKGFQIISLSIDKNRKDWIAALNKKKMKWPQILIPPNDSIIRRNYGITLIPKNILISKKGGILARNLRDQAIAATLDSLYDF